MHSAPFSEHSVFSAADQILSENQDLQSTTSTAAYIETGSWLIRTCPDIPPIALIAYISISRSNLRWSYLYQGIHYNSSFIFHTKVDGSDSARPRSAADGYDVNISFLPRSTHTFSLIMVREPLDSSGAFHFLPHTLVSIVGSTEFISSLERKPALRCRPLALPWTNSGHVAYFIAGFPTPLSRLLQSLAKRLRPLHQRQT